MANKRRINDGLGQSVSVIGVNLPPTIETISLWDSVHDAELLSIESGLLARTVKIKFAEPFLNRFHKLPDGLTFVFLLEGVESVRASRFAVWPGEFPLPTDLDWEETERRCAENRRKWREESECWTKFKSEVNHLMLDDRPPRIGVVPNVELTDGEMIRGDGAALRLGIRINPTSEDYNVFLRAEQLSIWRSDQQRLSVDEFLALGCAYWEYIEKKANGVSTS